MDKKEFITTYVIANGKYFSEDSYPIVKLALERVPESKLMQIYQLNYKSRFIVVLLSLFAGVVAADRFYLGDKLYALVKLLLIWFSFAYCMLGLSTHVDYDRLIESNLTENQIFGLTILAGVLLWTLLIFIVQVVELFLCYRRVPLVNLDRLLALSNQLALTDRQANESEQDFATNAQGSPADPLNQTQDKKPLGYQSE